jgi:hypothetical protein
MTETLNRDDAFRALERALKQAPARGGNGGGGGRGNDGDGGKGGGGDDDRFRALAQMLLDTLKRTGDAQREATLRLLEATLAQVASLVSEFANQVGDLAAVVADLTERVRSLERRTLPSGSAAKKGSA